MRNLPYRFLLILLFLCAPGVARSDENGSSGYTGPGDIPLPNLAEGAEINAIRVVSRGGNNPARDETLLARVKERLADLQGETFNRMIVEARLAKARERAGVKIGYKLESDPSVRGVILVVEIDMSLNDEVENTVGRAIGASDSFPTLYRSERALFTTILAGGFGAYSDGEPWFGVPLLFNAKNPIAGHLPGSRATWTEGFAEPGIGAAVQIGDSPIYAFGAVTALTSWSFGQDIYRNDPRVVTRAEKAYAGFLYVDPDKWFSVSVGRQNLTVNDGFLVHFVRGSSNAGARGGLYLGPRNANDMSVSIDGRAGAWSWKGFYIDPDELSNLESKTTFLGLNVRHTFGPDFYMDGTVLGIPRSVSHYANPQKNDLPREGLITAAAHMRWRNPVDIKGVWLESEIAHQSHARYAMSAFAAYGLAGYMASDLPWTPSISYRLAYASGDNPTTKTYERFDPLLSTGLGNWLQGVTFGKLTTNSNLAVHRIQFNVTPNPALNLTFDFHRLLAPQLNNLGSNPALGTLSSHDLGKEFTWSARWAISRNFFLQSLVSLAYPGQAFQSIGATRSWTTLQASLYWSL